MALVETLTEVPATMSGESQVSDTQPVGEEEDMVTEETFKIDDVAKFAEACELVCLFADYWATLQLELLPKLARQPTLTDLPKDIEDLRCLPSLAKCVLEVHLNPERKTTIGQPLIALGCQIADALSTDNLNGALNFMELVSKTRAGAWFEAYLRATLREMTTALNSRPAADQATISFETLSDVVDDDGKVDLEKAAVADIKRADMTRELTLMDQEVGFLKILTASQPDNDLSSRTKMLGDVVKALPIYKKLISCEIARDQAVNPSSPQRKTEAENLFFQVFQDFSKELSGFEGTPTDNDLINKSQRYKAHAGNSVMLLGTAIVAEIKDTTKKLEGRFINVSGICKQLPDTLDDLINWEGKPELMNDLKALQGNFGRGIKILDRVAPALKCAGIEIIDGEAVADTRKHAIDIRGKGRLQISCRTAAQILKDQRGGDIKSFYVEVKNLHVTLPAKLRAMTDALQQEMDG